MEEERYGKNLFQGFSRFEVWFMELGILTLHGRIFHPQTQGKEERFNGSLTREFLKYESFEDFEDAKIKLDKYRDFYNTKRPHYALNLDTPAKQAANRRQEQEREKNRSRGNSNNKFKGK